MNQKRYLFIGAHPDDMDIRCGGTAFKLAKAGHIVKFVSLCNGNCGHYNMSLKPEDLANRRYAETQASKKFSGIEEYQVWLDVNDCELEASLENRKRIIRMIREFNPDVVFGHRLCDYHADHRAAALLVQDAAYLSQVPRLCPETPIQKVAPVFGCVWDAFVDPVPFHADAAIPVDDVMDEKCRMLDCHVSQVYEWLAWERKVELHPDKMTWQEKCDYLIANWGLRYVQAANEARDLLIRDFGEAGKNVKYAETFSLSPYGRKISTDEFKALMRGE